MLGATCILIKAIGLVCYEYRYWIQVLNILGIMLLSVTSFSDNVKFIQHTHVFPLPIYSRVLVNNDDNTE